MRIYRDVQQVWFGNFFRSIAISNSICPGFLENKPTKNEIELLQKLGWEINLKVKNYLVDNFSAIIISNNIDKIFFKTNKLITDIDINCI